MSPSFLCSKHRLVPVHHKARTTLSKAPSAPAAMSTLTLNSSARHCPSSTLTYSHLSFEVSEILTKASTIDAVTRTASTIDGFLPTFKVPKPSSKRTTFGSSFGVYAPFVATTAEEA
ncbi:hypothetical protein AbraIFM66951_010802 [Aspergillus brasiliensis]|uniref:Uncharacterized protein n=1 Tax=Aspergillus brasiliensis TaxID=319629 RepID=A0A9W5YP78_9EURO|nr:hypothetical protein AbraCBS73388_004769 [Aspergillus brasiliensis]GKZ47436.1 hypothetical protein AbraIFM66951_010802 [Aspergillus brasiliensis]